MPSEKTQIIVQQSFRFVLEISFFKMKIKFAIIPPIDVARLGSL